MGPEEVDENQISDLKTEQEGSESRGSEEKSSRP